MSKPNEFSEGRPDDEAIAKRAYELYLQRGSVPGYELDDWLQAKAELTAAAASAIEVETPPQPGRDAETGEQDGRRNGRERNPTRRAVRQ